MPGSAEGSEAGLCSECLTACMHAGGDWGSAITSALGGLYPQHCRAIHINMCFAAPSLTNPWHVLQVGAVSLSGGVGCRNAVQALC